MCDTVVAITDDGVTFAKNSDRDPNEGQALEWHAAADHVAGSVVACTYVEVPQVSHTHATVISRPWWMFGAEMGVNEFGVAVGNEAVYTTAPAGPPALLGMDLVRLALERARTAADAVDVIVSLLERHGQGGACSRVRTSLTYDNSFLVADPAEAYVVDTAGRHHAVERVTSGVRAISNGLSVEGFAERFARATKARLVGCALRRAASEEGARRDGSVLGLMSSLRCHGDAAPTWSPVHGSLRGPCVHGGGIVSSSQTTASLVAHLAADPTVWATATSAPCTSVFKPVRVGEPVDLGPPPTDRFDAATLWWRHEVVHRRALRDYASSIPAFARERDALEREWVASPPTGADAVGAAEDLTARWRATMADLVDARPDYVRWRAAEDDRAASMPPA